MTLHDRRGASERRVRAAWRGTPGPGLRVASRLFGFAVDVRNLAYEAGLAASLRVELPVLSVGGLTVGGSGKTPVAAAAARGLAARGVRPAVVTRGFADELAVHRRLAPRALVLGAAERRRAAEEAAVRGAKAIVLDDGFQHRRIQRDLEWVTVAAADLGDVRWRRLPSGPARDRWGELARADTLVLTARDEEEREVARTVSGRIVEQFPRLTVAVCELRPGGLEPVNGAARRREGPSPRVAFASVMRGREFLNRLGRACPTIRDAYLFPDHHAIDEETLDELERTAGRDGMVGTLKDVVKITDRVGPDVPLWYVSEELVWWSGSSPVAVQLDRLASSTGGGSGLRDAS